MPQMGSLVAGFDAFMVMFLSWLFSLSCDSCFHVIRVNRKFLFPFLNRLVIFWLRVHKFLLLAFGNLDKRRDRTIQRVGDGAEQFGFTFLDQAVRTDDLHVGFDQILFDLRRG